MKDPHHTNNKLFQLLWSGKRLHSHAARTERLKQAIRTVKSDLTWSHMLIQDSRFKITLLILREIKVQQYIHGENEH